MGMCVSMWSLIHRPALKYKFIVSVVTWLYMHVSVEGGVKATISSKSVRHSRQSTMLKSHRRAASVLRWMGGGGGGGTIKGYKVRKAGRANERKSAGNGC